MTITCYMLQTQQSAFYIWIIFPCLIFTVPTTIEPLESYQVQPLTEKNEIWKGVDMQYLQQRYLLVFVHLPFTHERGQQYISM